MMGDSIEIVPGSIVYSIHSDKVREKDGFIPETVLAWQISGSLNLETPGQQITTKPEDIVLIRKNQLHKLTKYPLDGQQYKIILVILKEDILRKYALEHPVEVPEKYSGNLNLLLSRNAFLQGYFQSLLPYIDKPQSSINNELGILKVKEAIGLLLNIMPELRSFLFDFSEPHKMDLEKFMLSSYHFNVPIEKFAQLTGRSLAGFKRDFQKTFNTSPRQWLQDKRLEEAYYQIKRKGRKPSAIYLDLGFESLSHFSHSFKQRYGIVPSEIDYA